MIKHDIPLVAALRVIDAVNWDKAYDDVADSLRKNKVLVKKKPFWLKIVTGTNSLAYKYDTIYISGNWSRWTSAQLAATLIHEFTHIYDLIAGKWSPFKYLIKGDGYRLEVEARANIQACGFWARTGMVGREENVLHHLSDLANDFKMSRDEYLGMKSLLYLTHDAHTAIREMNVNG